MKRIVCIFMFLVMTLTLMNAPGNVAYASQSSLLIDYLVEHEEYGWADWLDINEDGIDEL